MGMLQIANHMVCSTFRSSFSFPEKFLYIIYEQKYLNVLIVQEKRQICISLPPLISKTMEHRWRVRRRGMDLALLSMVMPALQSPLTHRNRQALNSLIMFFVFPQWIPIMGHLQWNERKTFSSLIEEHQRRKGDTRKMTTMKRKLKLFYWTGSIASHPVYEVITISHIITHD